MKYRIITHGNCTDGYCSAFVVKKFFNVFFGTTLTEQEIQEIPVLGVQPQDIQAGKVHFSSGDIVVDLPPSETKIFFWCDHHLTNKPTASLPKNYHWKATPSCSGFLIDIALEKGAKSSKELLEFRKVIDINDGAAYTKKDIKDCYYKRKNYQQHSPLQKLAMIGSMFNTRDRILNDEIFRTLLTSDLGETPLSSESLWQLNPLIFHRAQLESFELWRKNVDTYLAYDAEAQCVIQDDRKAKINIGVPDRFYSYMKFPEASYHVNLRIIDEEKKARVGIGSNIFHKERCKVNISELCQELGKKFGGSGGGHFYVGGAVVRADKVDEALAFILEAFKKKE
ncbi:MAG: DHHA1 domain-containing protein [Nanoarchaeota archaeon]|nr:DHHA1 domain-containing protein [Nanoarchaeota archaeon]